MSFENETTENIVNEKIVEEIIAIALKPTTTQRRVGRVERWLRKGYGFIIDLGELDADESRYGWTSDERTGDKAFVYHNALKSDTENVFHRLFANEYVEFTIDFSLPSRSGRLQAFDVTGLKGTELLCDLNAAAAALEENEENVQRRNQQQRQQRQQVQQVQQAPPGATVQYIYYVPTNGNNVVPPQPTGFPPLASSGTTEPSYVMPVSGIPVPK